MKQKPNHSTAAKRKVFEEVRQRDNEACVCCSRFVDQYSPAHHEPARSHGGLNLPENLVTVCQSCHNERHFGKRSAEYRDMIKAYLKQLYGGGEIESDRSKAGQRK